MSLRGRPVPFFHTVFSFLRYNGLLGRSSSTNQRICLLQYVMLYCCSTWWVGWLVGGWIGRRVGVSCGTLVNVLVRVGDDPIFSFSCTAVIRFSSPIQSRPALAYFMICLGGFATAGRPRLGSAHARNFENA